ncbi:hypothetical protein C8F04DRAFT_42535 [Mycena alexandri]|uniref:SH3 domain-containing protein n=1 Tax=Mycena alexandri TaxID=1745969 RepID=A0AAD6SJW7_9AGAR|nr:hypothetical protein C8F04DRAFT_42535 [Mycena alexandri]
MHLNLQRLPAEQVRQRKRLPFQGRPDAAPLAARQVAPFSLTGIVTLTQVIPVNPVTTPSPPPTTPTPPPATPTPPPATPTPPPATPTPPTAPVSSPAPPPVAPSSPPVAPIAPVASAINPIANPQTSTASKDAQTAGLSAVSSQHGLPVGAIVGITIAVVVLILGAFVFFIRQRAMRNRKTRRATATWISQPRPTNSSFDPRGVAPFPPPGGYDMGEASPGVSFARAQAAAIATRPPVANMPAPVPSSYNNPAPMPIPAGAAAASATVRYEFIPSLPDELSITTGEIVRVVAEYDDGWALCANARAEQGMVPLECLDLGSPVQAQATLQPERRNSRRSSSLGTRY